MTLRTLLILVPILALATAGSAKTARNYYTPERLAWMQENLDQYEWAQEERDNIIARADRWAKYDDETLQRLVPPLEVPRCNTVHSSGCPVHGDAILKYPGRSKSWKISFDKPWKIQCPVDGEWYPSNDFAAYLEGGCKDESLLEGEYVDDGWGCEVPGVEKKFWFVGYYAGEMVKVWLLPAIEDMSRAYLLTGDATYAHKTALLLWKLAQFYPDYLYEKQSRYALEFMPWYNGRLQYHTWECFTIHKVTLAYDAIWPAIAADAELERFTGKAGSDIREDIEERMLRLAARDITDGSHRIAGNYGMHQSALLRIALVLSDDQGEPTSKQMVDWVLNGPEKVSLYTDTPLPDAIVNLFHRDGVPFESPSYNCGWMTELEDVADLLLLNGVDVWSVPRFRGLYEWPLKMLVGGTMTQPMGDSNHMFAGGLGVTPTYLERAFQRIGDPRQAKVMVQCDVPFRRDLFQKSMEVRAREVAAEIPEPVGVTSELLPGLGYATLQTGNDENRSAVALHYGYHNAHRHYDTLNLEVYGHDHPLIPDLGYPETADTFDPRRFGWLAHCAVHNTVMVNASRQELAFGEPVAYHGDGWAQLVEARSPATYPGVTEDYRRACLLIDIDDSNAYCLDLFRIVGGTQHDWLIHGGQADFSSQGLDLTEPREEGTLAGADVPYGKFYDDPDLIEGKPGTRYHTYKGSAFQWLTNVQEAPSSEAATVSWRLNRDPNMFPKKPTEGMGLRVHLLGADERVFVCDGIPQRRKDFPDKLKWLVRRRQGEALASTFATVFEPFANDAPLIQTVERVPVTPEDGSVAVRVTFATGSHVVFWTPDPGTAHEFGGYRIEGRAACVKLDAQGLVVAARLFDGTLLTTEGLRIDGKGVRAVRIEDIDYEANTVTLESEALTQELVGRWVPVRTPEHVTAVRIDRVIDARTFSLGEQDLRCGTGGVTEIDETGTVKHDRVIYFGVPGMTVLNEAGDIAGKLLTCNLQDFSLRDKQATPVEFPDADGDNRRRFTIMAIGSGDELQLSTVADWPR